MVDQLNGALLPAIADAEGARAAAFQAFFKDIEKGADVSNLLLKIAEGAPAFPADTSTNGAPLLACLSGKGQMTGKLFTTGEPFDAFDRCNGTVAASSLTGTKYIAICYIFWSALAEWRGDSPPKSVNNQPAENCLSLSRNQKQFQGTDDDRHGAKYLARYQMWALFQMISRSYHYNWNDMNGEVSACIDEDIWLGLCVRGDVLASSLRDRSCIREIELEKGCKTAGI